MAKQQPAAVRASASRGFAAATMLVELAAAYGFGSLAINSGAWWQYLLTVLLAGLALRNFVQLVKVHPALQRRKKA